MADKKEVVRKLGCDWCGEYLESLWGYQVEPKEDCLFKDCCQGNTKKEVTFRTFKKRYEG